MRTPTGATFDLQAHRGGRGETTEESATAFRKALALGVSTLELDIVVTRDGVPAVWHDPEIQPEKCSDTKPVKAGDKQFPYVGKLIHELTWAQVQTLDCGKKLKDFPDAEVVSGNKIIQLSDVFAIAEKQGADDVRFNVETKTEADHPERSATPAQSVKAILDTVEAKEMTERVMIQSFDWRTLPLVHSRQPGIPLVLLWDETTWRPGSPWTGPVDHAEVHGDIMTAAERLDATILSPGYTQPYGMKIGDAKFRLVADKEFVAKAHERGLTVVPWTINDRKVMAAQIDAGADGIITDHPTILRDLMAQRGMELPQPHPAR